MIHRISRKASRVLVCAGSFGLASALFVSAASAQNLLTDPGFELQTAAPNPNPTGIPGWGNFGGANFLSTPLAHSGSWVLDTPDNGGGYNVPGSYQTFIASPGQTFTLSSYVYTPNALVAQSNDYAILQLDFYSGAAPSDYAMGTDYLTVGTDIGTPAGAAPAGLVTLPQATWTLASVSATAPAGTNTMACYLLDINADSNADFYFDDASLTATSVPEPASLGLLCLGGIAALHRRRRRA
jgi:PEP-CTERM motif